MHLYMICCLIVVTLLLLKTISVLLSPLRTVRGPLIARFTDLWYLWRVKQGRFEYENIALHEKYGPVVRYGSNRYSLNHPDAIKAIYGPASRLPKSSWYDTWASPGQWTIFADRSIKRHADNKRMYQNAFSMTTLVQYESFVDECSDLFVRRLEEAAAGDDDDDDVTKKSSSTADMDIGHWFHCYAFDVIGQITYAERLGFMETGQDVGGLMAMLSGHIEYATLTGIYSWLHPYLFAWRNYWAGSKGSGRQFIVNFTQNKMAENNAAVEKAKSKSTGDQPDHDPTECMLAKFAAKHTAQPDAFTKFHVLAGCVSNMVAGSDTTSLSLSAILYYLLRNPACLAKLHGEIDGLHRKGLLSTSPTLQETQGMPYLQAVIKEALRLHPAGGLPLERVVAEGGLKIGDTFFPEGVSCLDSSSTPCDFGSLTSLFLDDCWHQRVGRAQKH